jgi:organic radical activating enzyme
MQTTKLFSTTLPLMEHFNTIQGEGFHAGKAAYFLRLGGCNIGCSWCDVKESWDASVHPQVSIQEMLEFIQSCRANTCVVTGGEPMMNNLLPLTDLLHQHQIQLHVETSGAYSISGNWDWLTLSPKRFKKPLAENLAKADELKVVIYHPNDFRWAEENAEKVNKKCELYLQPEWSKSSEMVPLMVEYIKQHPKWKISLQIHKFMNIP